MNMDQGRQQGKIPGRNTQMIQNYNNSWPPTNGNREAIQWNTNISEVNGRDMENGEVMTALELAYKQLQSRCAYN